jgi:hypothetical protein
MTPLCIDLFAGMFGFSAGWLELGGRVIGFDIEHHVYGEQRYPAQLAACAGVIKCVVLENVAKALSKRHHRDEVRIVDGNLSRWEDKWRSWRSRPLALPV